MTGSRRKLIALYLTALLLVPVIGVSLSGVAAAGNTLDSRSVSVGSAGNVDVGYNIFSSAGNDNPSISVAYDGSDTVASGDDLQFRLVNQDTSPPTDIKASSDFSGTSGTATLKVKDSELTGDFTAGVQLLDTSGAPTTIAQDTATFHVRDTSSPPTVDLPAASMRPFANKSVAIGYDSNGVSEDNLELRLYNDTSGNQLNTAAQSGSRSKGGDFMELNAGSDNFDAKVELVNTNTDTVLASDTETITVSTPSVTLSKEDHSDGIDVQYNTGPVDAARFNLYVFDKSGTTIASANDIASGSNTKTFSSGQVSASGQVSGQAVLISTRGFLASDTACLYDGSDNCAGISSTSLEYTNGTAESDLSVNYNGGSFGLSTIDLVENGNPSNRDLASVNGVSTSKDLWINFTLSNTNAGTMMANADVKEWFTDNEGGGSEDVHIRVEPTQVFRNETINTRDPDRWGPKNGKATLERTQVRVRLQPLPPNNPLEGATLTSDAQVFRPPQFGTFDGNKTLRIPAAGPHFETDGTTNNTGFYKATIPSALVNQMPISNPTGMSVAGLGESATLTETNSGGVKINATVHYSSGNIDLVPDDTDPTADAGSDISVGKGETFSFDGSGSSDNSAITKYEWDTDGDGNYELTGETPSHSYSSIGDQTVTLKVTDGNDNTDTDTVTVSVTDSTAPTADAGSTISTHPDLSFTLDGSGSSDNQQISTYEWDVDDDSNYELTGETPSHSYASPGDKTVTLKVTDGNGNTDTDTVTVAVRSDDSDTSTDTSPPLVFEPHIGESNGSMVLSVKSYEHLGRDPGDLVVTVTGPTGDTDTFDRTEFVKQSQQPHSYSLSVTQPYADGDGTYSLSVLHARDAAGNDGGNEGTGSGLTDTYNYTNSSSDTTPPSLSNVTLGESSGNMTVSFLSTEQLDTNLTALAVNVTGPSGTVYVFDRGDFAESGSGPYTYTLSATQAYDAGNGTYSVTIPTANDAAGNNGGGTGLTDTYTYNSGDERVYDPGSVAAGYDKNDDGEIGHSELGDAASDYSQDQISLSQLGEIARAYAKSEN